MSATVFLLTSVAAIGAVLISRSPRADGEGQRWKDLATNLGLVGDEHVLDGIVARQRVQLQRRGDLARIRIALPGEPFFEIAPWNQVRPDPQRPGQPTGDGAFDALYRVDGAPLAAAAALDAVARQGLVTSFPCSVAEGQLCADLVLRTVTTEQLGNLARLARRLAQDPLPAATLAERLPREPDSTVLRTQLALLAERAPDHALTTARTLFRTRKGELQALAIALLERLGTDEDLARLTHHRRGLDPDNIGAVSLSAMSDDVEGGALSLSRTWPEGGQSDAD